MEACAMRRIPSLLATVFAVLTLTGIRAEAQTPAAAAPATTAASEAPAANDQQKPPAAVGEAGVKPTRGFVSALGHNLVDDLKHIPRRNSAYWLAGGTALAFAVHGEDGKINRRLAGNSTADTVFKPGKYIGNGGVVVGGSMATYLAGRWMKMPRLQHLGMDEIEGAILSQAISEAAKITFRRERPLHPDGKQAAGYSLPSGHATLTFTAATILQQHLGYKAAIPTYLIASYVAMSRLHDNNHYASDVIAGAATGIIIGRSVTYHGRNFWGGPMFVPGGAGVQFVLAQR
jgi:membrane-associated phospholipid phosphatase